MTRTKEVLRKRLLKLEKHYEALSDYKKLIEEILKEKNIYNIDLFEKIEPRDRAVLDAYLKYCVDHYNTVESYYNNARTFANRFFSGEEF